MNKYQSYKPSGVEWIGEIPEKWRISKFKYVSKLYTGNSLNDEQKILYESDDENHVPYVSSKDIDLNTRSVNYNNGLRIPKENNPLKVSPKDSFLLCVEGGSSGRKMVYLDREVCFVNKLCSFKSIENTRFQYYFIQSSNFQDKFRLSLSGLIGGVSISTLRDFELVLPSIEEQHQIVQFLDEKTKLIDRLISTKERKITLLKEQRTSLINHIVTKGLNPIVKMKDSGVEWIGEIPEHWKKSKVKYVTTIFGRIGYRGYTVEDIVNEGEGVITISPSNIQNDTFTIEGNNTFLSYEKYEESPEIQIFTNDIILVKTGSTIGKTSIIPNDVPKMTINPQLVVLKNIKIDNRYFYYQTVCEYFKKSFMIEQTGSTTPTISQEKINGFPILVPPKEEQVQVVKFLDIKIKEIDDLVSLEQKKIDLLKEYRQSLISEVVTGKINVTTNE